MSLEFLHDSIISFLAAEMLCEDNAPATKRSKLASISSLGMHALLFHAEIEALKPSLPITPKPPMPTEDENVDAVKPDDDCPPEVDVLGMGYVSLDYTLYLSSEQSFSFVRKVLNKSAQSLDEIEYYLSNHGITQKPCQHGGGGVGNALCVMARLGLSTAIIGTIGNDETGNEILRDFRNFGVNTKYLLVRQGQRSNFVVLLTKLSIKDSQQIHFKPKPSARSLIKGENLLGSSYRSGDTEYDPMLAVEWNDKGGNFNSMGRFEEAIQCFDRAIEIYPRYSFPWNNKGNSLRHLGRFDEALQCYDIAIEIDPQYKEAWNNKGNALYSLGRLTEALQCYDKTIEMEPQHTDAWYNKANTLSKLGRFKEAIFWYDKVIEHNRGDAYAWYKKALAEEGLEQWLDAVLSYKAFLRWVSDYPNQFAEQIEHARRRLLELELVMME